MGWADRVLHFSSNTGAVNTERNMIMTNKISPATISTIGNDIGKNSFHAIGFDEKGAIVQRQKLSRGQVTVRFANLPHCLTGMEACVGAHHLSRRVQSTKNNILLQFYFGLWTSYLYNRKERGKRWLAKTFKICRPRFWWC